MREVDPPPWGWASGGFQSSRWQKAKGNWSTLKRAAGLALLLSGDFTCYGDPEPLAACARGFLCSRASFGRCFSNLWPRACPDNTVPGAAMAVTKPSAGHRVVLGREMQMGCFRC